MKKDYTIAVAGTGYVGLRTKRAIITVAKRSTR